MFSRCLHGADSSSPAVYSLCELPYTEVVVSDVSIGINVCLLNVWVCFVLLRKWPCNYSVPHPGNSTKFRQL